MPEGDSEPTSEEMLAIARKFDDAVEAGDTPNVEDISDRDVADVPEEEVHEEPEISNEETEGAQTEGQDVDEQVSSSDENETPEEQEQTKSKREKSEERKTSSWKQINAEKEELKRQREELLKVAEEMKSQRQDIDEGKAYRDEHGFTAADYEKSADRAELEGEYDDAADARAIAKQVKSDGEKAISEMKAKKLNDAYENKRQELMAKHEDLQKPDSELFKLATAVLNQNPSMQTPYGLEKAVEIAQLQIDSASAKELKSQNKELTDKINKLEKKMSVTGGFTNGKVSGEKSFDDLSMDEQGARLLKAASEYDSNPTY